MPGIGSGRYKGSKQQKRNTLRVGPVRDAIRVSVWEMIKAGVFDGKTAMCNSRLGDVTAKLDYSLEQPRMMFYMNGNILASVEVEFQHYARHKFKLHRYLLCPECTKRRLTLYIYHSIVKCKDCHGLYYETYNTNYRIERQLVNVEKLRIELDHLQRLYAEYEARKRRGEKRPWRIGGRCHRPCRVRERIARLGHQVKLAEAKAWNKAAHDARRNQWRDYVDHAA